ncbi:response regulator [Desulfomicrobium escambiense]|uniref:response regulator n=1 Tax=Desulfomicrobium escambiense TaxID=29503 RepID=UPI000685698D|nr:response regulator [Desulfomicrobium escambiense]
MTHHATLPSGSNILMVDDDRELCRLLQEYCAMEGLPLRAVHNGEAGVLMALSGSFDLVILDVMMPGMSGTEALRRIRLQSMVPVLMLTAMGDDEDRILGLELGADDYVPKPCTPRELVARIRAILRRMGQSHDGLQDILSNGDIRLWPGRRTAEVNGRPLSLTGAEFSILTVLTRRAGQPVSRETLSEEGLGRPVTRFDRSLDVHLSSIRHKLGPGRDGRPRIQTLRGRGYQLLQDE